MSLFSDLRDAYLTAEARTIPTEANKSSDRVIH
jgi:hypothetical protein